MSADADLPLGPAFDRFREPLSGRRVVQLTAGEACCYPLYYFIPTLTANGRYLIYHRAAQGDLQLFRLDLATGQSQQLTQATGPDTQWRPWCVDSGRGVRDHRSVLNVARSEVVYFDHNTARLVGVDGRGDRELFTLPADREPYGQNCVTPDGRWLVYIDTPRGAQWGQPCRGARVVAYDFDTAEHRRMCEIDSAVFHVAAYDNDHIIITHPADHPGMLLTSISRGGCELLREGDPGVEGHLIHCVMTRRGIAYEVPGVQHGGLYDPLMRRRFEFRLPGHFGYNHTGWDPAGRLFFYENSTDHNRFETHDLYALLRLDPAGDQWLRLCDNWPTFGGGQKSHFHPQLTVDRGWLLFTAGDPRTQTCHIFLLDVSDLHDTAGLTDDLLSPTGANDRVESKNDER